MNITNAMNKLGIFLVLFVVALHSTGAIRPATTKDSLMKCGSVLCKGVSELYGKAKLSYGYNYVTTIPAGAMNMSIRQLQKSDNMLTLKTTDDIYLINDNNKPSESGIYEFNEDVFEYNRELGVLNSKGPLSEAVVLMLFVRGTNPGIQYDYTIPVHSGTLSEEEELHSQWNELGQPLDYGEENYVDSESQINRMKERKRRKFTWRLLGFSECNRACGPGIRPPIFRCIREPYVTRYYSPKRCAYVQKPEFSKDIYNCNLGLCPAYWRSGDYGECMCNGTHGAATTTEGVRMRKLECVQEQISGKVEQVDETQCPKEKLVQISQTCNCPNQLRRKIYARTPDKAPKVLSRLIGAPSLTARQVYNSTMPLRRYLRDDRHNKSGVWLMSEWNQQCASDCNINYEHRSIYCDRTPPFSDLCDLRHTPDMKRSCKTRTNAHCGGGTWFTSEWSNCAGPCYALQKKRKVLCLKNNAVAKEIECDPLKRPLELQNCTRKEVEYCGARWHYSEWSECSRSCGEGVQRRYAKCLEFDIKQNGMVESKDKCKYLEREPVYAACNIKKCEEPQVVLPPINYQVEQSYQSVEEEPEESEESEECGDEFENCERINRQRLCKLQYYQKYCCDTCSGYY